MRACASACSTQGVDCISILPLAFSSGSPPLQYNLMIDTGSSNAGVIGYDDPAVGDAYDRYAHAAVAVVSRSQTTFGGSGLATETSVAVCVFGRFCIYTAREAIHCVYIHKVCITTSSPHEFYIPVCQ